MFRALEVLTNQVSLLAQGSHGGGRSWDALERYRNLKMFNGDLKDYEEFATKFRSQVAAGDKKVERLMRAVETECTEDRLALNQFDECKPEFDENDAEFVLTSSSEMFNLLLNLTTGEANATVRCCQGLGWLAWKRLTSSLNPRTLASGIKAISAVLAPGKIQQATKADHEVDSWEDRMAKLSTEYWQILSAKMKVAVLHYAVQRPSGEGLG